MNEIIQKWEVNKRLEQVQFSGIANVIEKANKLGSDVIRLEVGDVDFSPPESMLFGIQEAFKKQLTHYPPLQGNRELINQIVLVLKKEGIEVTEEQVLICSGGSMGIYLTMQALLNPGDDVLIFEPIWPHLVEMLVLAGANPIMIPLDKNEKFHFDVGEVEKYITKKTKAIVVNTPNNPTGTVYTECEIKQLVNLCQKHNIMIISDEEYQVFTYGESKHVSPLSYYEATIVCRSFSKTLSISGLRVGYIIGPVNWVNSIKKLGLFTTMYSNSVVQYAIAKELSNPSSFVVNMVKTFEKRMHIVTEGLADIEQIHCIASEGSVYLWIDCLQINKDDKVIADKLLYDGKVAVVPGSCFGDSGAGFLRLSLGANEDSLIEAVKRMRKVFKKMLLLK